MGPSDARRKAIHVSFLLSFVRAHKKKTQKNPEPIKEFSEWKKKNKKEGGKKSPGLHLNNRVSMRGCR